MVTKASQGARRGRTGASTTSRVTKLLFAVLTLDQSELKYENHLRFAFLSVRRCSFGTALGRRPIRDGFE